MAGRRTNGSGSIFENNGKYTAQLRVGKNENGKPRFVKKTFKTKRECNEWLEKTRRKYGQLSQSEYSESQICELLQLWFDYKKDRLKPKSLDRIESTVNTHIIPVIGSSRLCDITSEEIQRLVFDNMQKKGLSKSSMKKAYDDLNNFFNFCIDSDWLDKSPMRRVSIDNYNCKPEKRVNSFDREQMTAIVVSSLEQYGNGTPVYECGLIFPVMYLTGMRISEALGLKWRCVDFENEWIDIKETVVSAKDRNSGKQGRQQIVQESGKTRNSLRRIPLSKAALKLLQKQKERRYYGEDYFVFNIGREEIRAMEAHNISRSFTNILKKNNIRHEGVHSLRHTFATDLSENDVDEIVIKRLLGHSNSNVTMRYIDTRFKEMKKAVKTLDTEDIMCLLDE